MPLTSPALYEHIEAFDFDGPDTKLTLSMRLARENRWSQDFAKRVIEEYRKFTYLACVAGQTVTPSDEVDQAWHLHLTYTRNYWDRFCKDILEKPLHHDPTTGGEQEDRRYERLYEETLKIYEKEFGYKAPADIWPASSVRFSKAVRMKRIDISENWLIPKSPFTRPLGIGLLSAASLSLAGCTVFGFELTEKQVIIGSLILILLIILIYLLTKVKRKGGGCGSGCSSGDSGCSSGCGGGGCGGD